MDIQKEKELYLAELLERGALKQYEIDDLDFKTEISAFHSSYLSARFIDNINFGWSAWQAAKAQAVPEGFVLIKASDRDREVCELIDERDHFENQAEQLKDKLQDLYGEDFGEHSNCNCPFQNAIDFDDSDLVLVPKDPDADTLTKMSEAVYLGDDASGVAVYLSIDECKMAYKAMIEAQEQKVTELKIEWASDCFNCGHHEAIIYSTASEASTKGWFHDDGGAVKCCKCGHTGEMDARGEDSDICWNENEAQEQKG